MKRGLRRMPMAAADPTGITQTYNSLHIQPIKLVTFGVNYNYLPESSHVLIPC